MLRGSIASGGDVRLSTQGGSTIVEGHANGGALEIDHSGGDLFIDDSSANIADIFSAGNVFGGLLGASGNHLTAFDITLHARNIASLDVGGATLRVSGGSAFLMASSSTNLLSADVADGFSLFLDSGNLSVTQVHAGGFVSSRRSPVRSIPAPPSAASEARWARCSPGSRSTSGCAARA